MTFVHKTPKNPRSIAVLAGAFNPPTLAHLALAEAALGEVDEVLLAIPRRFPHKEFHGATLDQRLLMLRRIAESNPGLSAAVAEGGLFVEIAREATVHYPEAQISLVCGRDAAERILTWDYGDPRFVDRMLEEFSLLVAPRDGSFQPEDRFRDKVRSLRLASQVDEYSSTRLRDARERGGDWRSLAPACIADLIEEIYS